MAKAKSLYLIDGTALAYRSFFAFMQSPRGGLSTQDGRPTSAVYGFLTTLKALLDREKPDALAVSFDAATEGLERTRIFPEYKSTRDKMPDEMAGQLGLIDEVVRGYHIPIILNQSGYEADDVIGTLALRGKAAGMKVFIVTGDKDFMQIVDDDIKLYNLRSSATAPEIIGAKEVEKKFGVRPDQIIDLLALMGDSSDNIPGVPRVGQKTAANLLQQFQTLDEVLDNTELVKQPSIRKNLTEYRDQALLSRDLVTLYTDVEVDVEVQDIGAPQPDRSILEPLFRDLEFTSLLKSLPREDVPEVETHYQVARSEEELTALTNKLRDEGSFAVTVLTTTPEPHDATLVGIAFAWQAGQATYVPFNQKVDLLSAGALLSRKQVTAALQPILEDPDLHKVSSDAKLAMALLRNAGIEARGFDFDTTLASYCVQPGIPGGHAIDTLAVSYLSRNKTPLKDLIGTGKKQKRFDEVEIDHAGDYACEEADLTWCASAPMQKEMAEYEVEKLYQDIEMPLLPVLMEMEWQGIRVDLDHLKKLSNDLGERLQEIETRIYDRAGEPFNLNAPAQIGEVLFGKLEVHKVAGVRPKKTRTGQFKTDATVLEQLAKHHEVPELILDYRQLSKLKTTYVDSLPAMVNEQTGRIHTTFNQAVAATGRLSSEDPNLQNIPIRTEEGRAVRKAFVPREKGWVLLSADYSQIELRILAHMSGDPALVKAFQDRADIHARTAALVHGMMPEMVTPELRNQAKVINYGLMYGMGASRLARETGMTPPEAKQFIDGYFRALPKVKELLDRNLEVARETRVAHTLFGRRRPLPEIDSSNAMQRIGAENMAVNTPIQGTAADIIKLAMLKVHARLEAEGMQTKLLLQVHDELVLDVPEAELEAAQTVVRESMEHATELKVPLEVAMGQGSNWLEAH